MHAPLRRTITAIVLLAAVVAGTGAVPAVAAPAPTEHCVLHVLDQRASGELVVGPATCYASFELAMSAEGVDAWGTGASERVSAAALTFTIGIHYDGFGFSGASTSVVGSDCNGGWLNVSSAWNNRISSTEHGCPKIRHYDGYNRTGASQTTYDPGGNLSTLNNKTSSIAYLT